MKAQIQGTRIALAAEWDTSAWQASSDREDQERKTLTGGDGVIRGLEVALLVIDDVTKRGKE